MKKRRRKAGCSKRSFITPAHPKRAKTRPFPFEAAGEISTAGVPIPTHPAPSRPRPALFPWCGTLRIFLSRERSSGRGTSWRAWGRVGAIRPFSTSCYHLVIERPSEFHHRQRITPAVMHQRVLHAGFFHQIRFVKHHMVIDLRRHRAFLNLQIAIT
jgi:hypothetical protein